MQTRKVRKNRNIVCLFDKQKNGMLDFINIYENNNNFTYGDFICKGYSGYYCYKYNNKFL